MPAVQTICSQPQGWLWQPLQPADQHPRRPYNGADINSNLCSSSSACLEVQACCRKPCRLGQHPDHSFNSPASETGHSGRMALGLTKH